MINVAFFISSNQHASNGAAGYIRQIYSKTGYFENRGINMLGPFCGPPVFTDAVAYEKTLKSKLKRIIKTSLSKTAVGTPLAFKHAYIVPARYAVKEYIESRANLDVAVFNDSYVYDEFLRRFPEYKGKCIFVMHSNGVYGKMLLEMFPNLSVELLEEERIRLFNRSDRIVLVSETSKDNFCQEYPEYASKAIHIHTGIDALPCDHANKQRSRPESFIELVSVGTINTRKNQLNTINALNREIFRRSIHLTLVGDGPAAHECEKAITSAQLDQVVSITGTTNAVSTYLNKADAFILASYDEGLPIAALEAMSVGLPLLLTDVGGCRELINGNGMLIGNQSVGAIGDAIEWLLNNQDQLPCMRQQSKDIFIKNYTTETMCEEYVAFFKDLFAYKGRE